MSDQRGMWGNSRPEDNNMWWNNSGIAASDANTHQQLLAAHQQQLVAAHQQAQVAQSTAAAAHQLFSYKMATSFSNSSGSNSPQTTVTSSMSPQIRGYDYRNLQTAGNVRHDDAGITASQAAVAAGWWYNPSLQNNMANMQNFQHAQNSHSLLNRQRNMPRGKSDAKPRGRMTAYAFFVQTCREEHKKKHPDENVVFAEFSKKCAERWKTMSDKEKKRFHEMAEKDKKRYESEMQNYIPPKGEKVRGKKRKHFKDPNAPKRALSAFFWFCNDERGAVKAANPDYGVGDIAKELGRKWADASSSTKQKYEAMAEKDKARYERDMTEYKKKSKPTVAPVPVVDDVDDEDEEEEDDDE